MSAGFLMRLNPFAESSDSNFPQGPMVCTLIYTHNSYSVKFILMETSLKKVNIKNKIKKNTLPPTVKRKNLRSNMVHRW